MPNSGHEILRAIEATDWSRTRVGPMASWPSAFRVVSRIMLASPMPMVLLMGPLGVLIYNQAYAAFAGDRHPGLLGKEVAEAWPEIADFNAGILKRVLAGETVSLPEQHLALNRSGVAEDLWLDLEYSPVLDEAGVPIGELVIFSECTQRVLSRRALERSEESLSFARAASKMIGVWDWDVTNDVVTSDARFAEMFGVDPQRAEDGAPIAEFVDGVHPEDRELLTRAIETALREREDLRCEYRLLNQDGRINWVLALGRVAKAEDGTLRLPGIVIDITREKDAAASLLASESQFRVLADTMPQMVWSTRPDGFHDYYNARWYEFTGMTPGSTDGEGWNEMFHPDDRERAWELWRHSLATGEPYQIEYRLRHRSGQYRWTLGRALPIRSADGEILRWIGTCTDIHEAKQLAVEREIVAQEMSHRIKNIFSVLTGLVGLAARSHPESQQFADELRRRIIALSKAHDYVRAQTMDDRNRKMTLTGLLEQLLEPYRTVADNRIAITGDDVAIDEAAATPLALMLHELATNAAKYGALGTDEGSVALSTRVADDEVTLEWREQGARPRSPTPQSSGFGSRLIDLTARGQLGGTIEREWRDDGLFVRLKLPLSALQRSARLNRASN